MPDSDYGIGLTDDEAESSTTLFGSNQAQPGPMSSEWDVLLGRFFSATSIMLVLTVLFCFWINRWEVAILSGSLLVMNFILAIFQERRARQSYIEIKRENFIFY